MVTKLRITRKLFEKYSTFDSIRFKAFSSRIRFVFGTIEFVFDSVAKSAIRTSLRGLKLNVIDTYYDD